MPEIRGAAPASVRRWNERAIITVLSERRRARVSELVSATGLTPVAIRDVLRGLADKGWVRAAAPEPGLVGRPARTYEFRDPPAHFLGLDVGGHTVRSVLLGPDGVATEVAEVPLARPGDPDAALDAIHAATHGAGSVDVWLTGLAVSGALDAEGVITRSVALPHLEGRRPEEALGSAVPGGVLTCHDTKAALWAEHALGSARGVDHVMLAFLGRRPSIAVLVNGQPYLGAHGTAGDLSLSELIPPRAYEAAQDPAAFLASITPQLAFAAALIDPALLVIGGAIAPGVRGSIDAFARALSERLQRPPRVAVSPLNQYAVATGAALLARRETIGRLVDSPAGVASVRGR